MNIDKDAPVVGSFTDSEICDRVISKNKESDTETVSESEITEERIPLDKLLSSLDDVIKGLEQREFATPQEIMTAN